MASAIVGGTKCDRCPVCNEPYREDRMVECTRCKKWCCYECVNVSDDVITNDSWICPSCEAEIIVPQQAHSHNTKGSKKNSSKNSSLSKSKKGSSVVSSRTKMRMQLIEEERELLRKERELAKEARLLLDEESDDSQEISDDEIKCSDPLANKMISLQIDQRLQRRDDNKKHNMSNLPPTTIGNIPTVDQKTPRLLQTDHSPLFNDTFDYNALTPQQYAARKTTPNDLPIFNGNPSDWPLFISCYDRSTMTCGFDNNENLLRLQKSIRGSARTAVASFLIQPECVPQIISTLKILYGRPEQIIEAHISIIRRQPPPRVDKLETLVEYALSVKNLCVSLEAAKLHDYLNNPILMHELIEKLPSQIKVNWAMHRSSVENFKGLTSFADWMYTTATNLCTALPTLVIPDRKKHFNQNERTNVHNVTHESNDKDISCKICKGKCSQVAVCTQFQNYLVSERWRAVKSLKLCRLCLKRHRFPCKYPIKCTTNHCQSKHHPLLHNDIDRIPETQTPQISAGQEPHHVSVSSEINMARTTSQCIRFRILPVTLKNGGKIVKTFAFLDEGSSVTLLNENIAKELDLRGTQEQLCLRWTGDQERSENNSKRVCLSIAGDYEGSKQFDFRPARTVTALSLPRQSLNSKELKQNYSYLKNLPFESYENANPQILIGLDNWELALPLRVREGLEGQPIAAKSRLGWTVFALLPKDSSNPTPSFNYHVCDCSDEIITNNGLHEAVKEYFSIESLGVQPSTNIISKELQRARNIQESTLTQNGNKYSIGLLWKYNKINLPDSRSMAIRRLECIEKRIKFNPELAIKINEQLEDFSQKNYIRKLSERELSEPHRKTWYLPIFPVFNPNKPGKFRIVWDAAASVQGISLNSMLLKGDDQLASLLGVLLRFRKGKIGFSADIKEMFLRIGIIDEDQQAQRFLWRHGDPKNPLETYVMSVMTFGASCSPSCAQFVKNTNANKYLTEYPRAVECITQNHYVDDLLDSTNTEEEAVTIAKQVHFIHSQANFEIRNWRSNSKKVSDIMNAPSDNPMEINMNIGCEKDTEKVLGMWWNLKTDCFTYSLRFNKGNKQVLSGDRKPTKREVLRILMSVYDPLGFLSNFLIYLKILLQEIWRSNISWDQPITDDHFKKWLIWLKQLPKLKEISIPRCYLRNLQNWEGTNIQMHVFVDASEHASAVVAYLRIQKENIWECVQLGAKTHVAPIKLQTIPRLELNGAVMGSRFAKSLREHLSIKIQETFYWSDSLIVLSWLRTNEPRKLNKYVAYRVAEIQENTIISNWRYVPTKLNAADEATKWNNQPFLEYPSRWFIGPDFLYKHEEFWPSNLSPATINEEIFTKHEIIENIINMKKFSKFFNLLYVLAYIYRFIEILRATVQKRNKPQGILTSAELLKSRNALIRMVQSEFYRREIKQLQSKNSEVLLQPIVDRSSGLFKLSPYLDEEGLLRIRGRIDAADSIKNEAKRPIILPRECHLTILIVEYYHQIFLHRNHETVVNEIRQKFYISQLRRVLYKVRKNCQTCKIRFATPAEPEMSPLPACRLATFTAPFTYTGVDYFGPINVTVGRRTEKRWGALFTCLTTRAVHLEIAYKLDVDSCILCFSNFMNRRGRPKSIFCDRGTNFIATERVLREELKKVDPHLIAKSFISPEIAFHFNSPLSPHMGGAWERLVKAVKISLYEALPSRTPSDPLLLSCLIAAENIVNSRPLTYLPLDSEESEALTPNHFLIGNSNGNKPIGQLNDDAKVLKFNYLYKEQFANKCWRRFVSEYIPKLLLRSKWYKQVNPVEVGDIVIICDKDLPRCNWPKGRVIEVKKAPDGQVRKARVQTIAGIFERPVVKLAVLSVKREKSEDGTALSDQKSCTGRECEE